ncbi:hypothetical protein E1293_04795 [Actinomadura darangshiensis]|uniref:PIN like domain-containing protein n=1 Tax=Actinomadura darangshiensis TaxID=705336 RepID=A0A4R5BRC0_9ACTN|nr:PIN-like domain-containing protein [Actinomadura darangshiensis]TDD89531.1 hypothetical protein E1293_04795 [Actinomadura darangshiensis]
MSGIDTPHAASLDRLEAVLNRQSPVDAIAALTQAVQKAPKPSVSLNEVALGFDASVFLRLATEKRSVEILDYLIQHAAPLVIPGQAIQEFWNNQLNVVDTVGTTLRKRFDSLAVEAKKIDSRFGDFEDEVLKMLERFQRQFGYIYDENVGDSVTRMLEILQSKSCCSFVPRDRFICAAQIRNSTRTPPGFKDAGDGDFYVWADFLFGLLVHESEPGGQNFKQVVLLTNDRKADWSTHGMPHPILTAEVRTLFDVPFDVWDLEKFGSEVRKSL